jgi:hypothetical protein
VLGELGVLNHALDSDPTIEAARDSCVFGGVLGEVASDAGSVPVAGLRVGCNRSRVDLLAPADHQLSTVGSFHRHRYSRRGAGDGLR